MLGQLVTNDIDRTAKGLRPIDDLPFDLSEEHFTRVKFLGNVY